MTNVVDCNIVASKFELQTSLSIYFWINALGKDMSPLIPPCYGLNNPTTVLLQEWI